MERTVRAIAVAAIPAFLCLSPTAAVAVDTIPFTQVNGGSIQVLGSVDGQAPVPMLVNLGAGVDVLSTALGQRFVLVDGKYVSLRLTGERVDLPIGKVLTLAAGSVRLEAPNVGIWSGLDASGVGGLISATAFRNITATFDFTSQKIIIEDAQTFPDRVRLSTRVPVVLQDDLGIALGIFARFNFGGGKTGLCEIDTGSQGITLDRTFAHSIGLDSGGATGPHIASIALDGAPDTAIAQPAVSLGNLIFDCDVGNSFWTGRSFTLDLPNRFIYVAKPN